MSSAARPAAAQSGVVDTLTAGYAAVNRQWWVLLIPLLLDLFLWQGPQVSLSPIAQPLVLRATEAVRQSAALQPPSRARAAGATTFGADLDLFRQQVMNRLDTTNALTLAARGPLDVPSVAVALGGAGAFSFATTWGEGLLLLVAGLLGGLALGGYLRGALAHQVRGGPTLDAAAPARRLPRDVLRVLTLALTLLGVFVLLGLPAMLLAGAATLVSPMLGFLGLALLGGALVFLEVHLFFAVDAVFVSDVGPLAAIQRSVHVVRRNGWATLRLVVLTWVILSGMDRVWEALVTGLPSPLGFAIALAGNAYIATGLIAASMIFYRDRAPALAAPLSPAPALAA